jgi:hypothetical protein
MIRYFAFTFSPSLWNLPFTTSASDHQFQAELPTNALYISPQRRFSWSNITTPQMVCDSLGFDGAELGINGRAGM